MLSNSLGLNSCYLKIIHILHPYYHPRIIGHIIKISKRESVCIHEIIGLIIMKIEMKMKKRYDIIGPRSRDGQKYSKYKTCLSIMMVICIKQHLSNISSSINEKIKQH